MSKVEQPHRSGRDRKSLKPRRVQKFGRRPELESLERYQLLSLTVFSVTTTVDSGNNSSPTPGSLRAAILQADALSSGNTAEIQFQVSSGPGSVVRFQIPANAPLPALSVPTFVNGFSEGIYQGMSGYHGSPLVTIDGQFLASGDGLTLCRGSNGSHIQGLSIVNFAGSSGGGAGINLESGGGPGFSGNILVDSNYLGLEPDGKTAGGNLFGINVSTSSNTLGGLGSGSGNVISGNLAGGILISPRLDASGTYQDDVSGNTVAGNLIGTSSDGSESLPNGTSTNLSTTRFGLGISGASNTIVSGNIITSAQAGVGVILTGLAGDISPFAPTTNPEITSGNLLTGNMVGLDITGTKALGNRIGVLIAAASGNTVGGSTITDRNVISGSQDFNYGVLGYGVAVVGSDSTDNILLGNAIGSDGSGQATLGNHQSGILIGYFDPYLNYGGFVTSAPGTASRVTVGGLGVNDGNMIVGNTSHGIEIEGTYSDASILDVIEGNRIGVFANGSGSAITSGNVGNGIYSFSADRLTIAANLIQFNQGEGINDQFSLATTIGGPTAAAGNIIVGNGGIGIDIDGRSTSHPALSMMVLNNRIGVFADGTGSAATSGNNGAGLYAENSSGIIVSGNTIQNNSGAGILLFNPQAATIGGQTQNSGNVIAANALAGIAINTDSTTTSPGNLILNNLIGGFADGSGSSTTSGNGQQGVIATRTSGLSLLGNTIVFNRATGVKTQDATGTSIGGGATDAGNRIAGNLGGGIVLANPASVGASDLIQRNLIGTFDDGSISPLSVNQGFGVSVQRTVGLAVLGNSIQGGGIGLGTILDQTPGFELADNVVAGSVGDGLTITDSSQGLISNNLISVSGGSGIRLQNSSYLRLLGNDVQSSHLAGIDLAGDDNIIGGTGLGESNVIANNRGAGIAVESSNLRNRISGNQIFGNLGLGIDLGNSGVVLPNGSGPGGPNNSQNYPVLATVTIAETSTSIVGSLQGLANTTYTLEIFSQPGASSSASASGQNYLGTLQVTTNSQGNVAFSQTLNFAVNPGETLSATATDPTGNTSEFALDLVALAATTTDLTLSLSPSTYGQPLTLTTMVHASQGTATGQVQFFDGTTLIGSVPVLSDGSARLTTSLLSAGSHQFSSSFVPSGNLTTSSSIKTDRVVNAAATSITLFLQDTPPIFGQPFTLTARVAAPNGPGTPTGMVVFRDGSLILATVAVAADGSASFTTSELAAGNHSLTATYQGANDYLQSGSSALGQTVRAAATTTTLSAPSATTTVGQVVTVSATVLAPGAPGSPSGTVSFFDGTLLIGTAAVGADGVARISTSILQPGPHLLQAVYGGGNSYLTSAAMPLSVIVAQASSATLLSTPLEPTRTGDSVTFSVSISDQANISPTGTVYFFEGMTSIGSVPVDGSGTASLTLTSLSAGSHSIHAEYSGDAFVLASMSPTRVVVVASQDVTGSLLLSATQAFFGQKVLFTANFTTNASGTNRLTGLVAFYDGDTYLGTALITSTSATVQAIAANTVTGQAVLWTQSLGVGSHLIRAVYSGDDNYTTSAATSVQAISVVPATTSTSLDLSVSGGISTLRATTLATSPDAPTLSGSIAFYDGDRLLGASAIINGEASLTFATPGSGRHAYRADYLGLAGVGTSSSVILSKSASGPKVVTLARYGLNFGPTNLVLRFDEPLDGTAAQNLSNYLILDGRGRRMILSSAVYDPSTQTVTLRTARPLSLLKTYTLTVSGSNILDNTGVAIDGAGTGQRSSDFKTTLTWRALTAPGAAPAVTFVEGKPVETSARFVRYVTMVIRATPSHKTTPTLASPAFRLASHRPMTTRITPNHPGAKMALKISARQNLNR